PLPTKPGFVDITHLLGTVESATIIECEPYQSDRPAMVAMARTLATLLDDPSLPGLHVQASRQLAAILTTLHRTRTPKSKGRLASVQNLTVKAT
ncbi:hypothetical protein, partial [Mycobacterium sp. OTB74]|uniref:hypothetical protein n=1 Tax=Mycobacterium sp. OTB74 TaxID=1853452 RepID=UPI0024757C42